MKYIIKIQNKNEIDTSALTLIGASSKREDDTKIGFFGSGNKYAIATLLRLGIKFEIYSGLKKINIATKPIMFKEQVFEQILIDGRETSMTTSMGIDWEAWFAIREFYSNAIDEGEKKLELTDNVVGEEGKTNIYIWVDEQLNDFFKNINKYFLVSKKPIETVNTSYGTVSFYENDSDEFIAYRKNIRIYPVNEIKSLYHYNFSSIEINESRTYKYDHQIKERIASALAVSKDKKIISNYMRNWKGSFEEKAMWEYVANSLSTTWHELLNKKRVYPVSYAIQSGDFEGKINSLILPDQLCKKIAKEITACEVVGYSQSSKYEVVEATGAELDKIESALQILLSIGYKVTSDIVIINPYLDDVVGKYEKETDTILLSKKYLTTTLEIANTILEEHFHSKGNHDGRRSFVTFLIDELITMGTARKAAL